MHRGGRQVHNGALFRYSRDELLGMYSGALPLQADSACEVYLAEPALALLIRGQPFTQPLGEDVNAERHVKAPEWMGRQQESKLPEEPLEGKFSSIDQQMEEKLKVEEEKEEALPEWAQPAPVQAPPAVVSPQPEVPPLPQPLNPQIVTKPNDLPAEARTVAKFSIRLLQDQVSKNNPFAKHISEHSRTDEQFAYVDESSAAQERAWYYRDPKGQVQGPFSWVDMYHWNLVGYFPATLPVALQKPEGFTSLAELFVVSPKPKPQEPEFSLFAYQPDKGRKPPSPPTSNAWKAKERPPAKSLADIQREEREGARKG